MRALLPACLVACLQAATVLAAEVFVSGPPLIVAPLREIVPAWEADTGHRVVWLHGDEHTGTADLIASEVIRAKNLWAQGKLAPLSTPAEQEGWKLPPLLQQSMALPGTGGKQLATLPVQVNLPTLRGNAETLSRAGASLPRDMSWDGVFDLAERASDPVGNVHGLCVAGHDHATVVRSLLSDLGLSWLDEEGLFYAGADWARQAERYARNMAHLGPANAASLTRSERDFLVARKKCALWLAMPGEPVLPGQLVATVPGAAAFASVDMAVIGLVANSERDSLAHSLAWWLSENALEKNWANGPAEETGALGQPGSPEVLIVDGLEETVDWQTVDKAGQEPLRDLINGLVAVDDALAMAREALAEAD